MNSLLTIIAKLDTFIQGKAEDKNGVACVKSNKWIFKLFNYLTK